MTSSRLHGHVGHLVPTWQCSPADNICRVGESGTLDMNHALKLCSIPVLLATMSVSSQPPPPPPLPGASHWNQLAMQL